MIPILRELCESRQFPSVKTVNDMETQEIAELLYLHLLAFRILATTDETEDFAKGYAHKTVQWGNFDRWRATATDLYVLLNTMHERGLGLKKGHYPLNIAIVLRWLRQISVRGIDEQATHRLFNRLDFDLRIRNDAFKSIRRLVIYWPDLSHHRRELAMTRLLQLFRSRSRKSDLLGLLSRIDKHHDHEMDGVCNPETGHGCQDVSETARPMSFLAYLQERKA